MPLDDERIMAWTRLCFANAHGEITKLDVEAIIRGAVKESDDNVSQTWLLNKQEDERLGRV